MRDDLLYFFRGSILRIFFYVIFFQSFKSSGQSSPPLPDAALQHLSEAIQIKTVSTNDSGYTDTVAFQAFKKFIENSYPLTNTLPRIIINEFSYIYKWQGKDSSLKPFVFMAHQDVVPVEQADQQTWRESPFSGKIINDTIWGRGAVDDKSSLIGILESVEQLLVRQYQPQRTIYLCFGHDEEMSGSQGAQAMARWFQQHKIEPELVLDEGSYVIEKNYSPLQRPVAMIGVGEKGYASFQLTVEKPGGHSSAPESETAIDILSTALVKLNRKQMPVRLISPTKEFLHTIKPYLPSATRFAINHTWLFKKKLIKKMEKHNGTNALIRTTIVTTIVKSGVKDNVIPAVATATVNSRVLQGETVADVQQFIVNQINDRRVKVHILGQAWEPSAITSTESYAYKKVQSLVNQILPGAITAPFLVIGATDSRFFRELSKGVINFSPAIDSQGIHSINEQISVADYKRLIHFYTLLIERSGE